MSKLHCSTLGPIGNPKIPNLMVKNSHTSRSNLWFMQSSTKPYHIFLGLKYHPLGLAHPQSPNYWSLCSWNLSSIEHKLSKEVCRIILFLGNVVISCNTWTCKIALQIMWSTRNLKKFPCLATWLRSTQIVCKISAKRINWAEHLHCLHRAFSRDKNKSSCTMD